VLAYILTGYDFGYTWPWTHGHLVVFGILALAARLGWKRLPWWITGLLAALAAWALAGFLIVQFVFGFNSLMAMPTEHFMAGGRGKVLDIGCGSGRTTIMVGTARPGVEITALDNFSADYIKNNGETLLRRNLTIAGINDRVKMMQADMRQIPAADGAFDGVVSSYAIDHLNRKGIEQTLGEVSRVMKPEGEFLLMIIKADNWMKVAFGPMLLHARGVPSDFWPKQLEAAHLTVVEEGTQPGTAYYVCRKP